jgi:hypothetical protein
VLSNRGKGLRATREKKTKEGAEKQHYFIELNRDTHGRACQQ